MNKKNLGFLIAAAVAAELLNSSTALGWIARVCNQGDLLRGMRTSRTFTLDRCNIPATAGVDQRNQVVLHGFSQWNGLAGIANRFNWVDGDGDCAAEGDDWIHWVTPGQIDNANGYSTWVEKPCRNPWNSTTDGRVIDAKIRISDALPLGASPETNIAPAARKTLLHEMGHILGLEHQFDRPAVMYDPSWRGALTVGSRHVSGPQALHTDTFMPDEVHFGRWWHTDQTAPNPDWSVSVQGFDSQVYNLGSGVIFNRCPGQAISYSFTVINKGTTDASTISPVQVITVLSNNPSAITNLHPIADSWSVWPAVGQWFTFTSTLVVPPVAPGDYAVGVIIDPFFTWSETDEFNNGAQLSMTIRVPNGC